MARSSRALVLLLNRDRHPSAGVWCAAPLLFLFAAGHPGHVRATRRLPYRDAFLWVLPLDSGPCACLRGPLGFRGFRALPLLECIRAHVFLLAVSWTMYRHYPEISRSI
jgi:hypothetical protein